MKIKVKRCGWGEYFDVNVKEGSTLIDFGLLDQKARLELAISLLNGVYDLVRDDFDSEQYIEFLKANA